MSRRLSLVLKWLHVVYIQTICVTSSCITYRSFIMDMETVSRTLGTNLICVWLIAKMTSLHTVTMEASDHIKRYVKRLTMGHKIKMSNYPPTILCAKNTYFQISFLPETWLVIHMSLWLQWGCLYEPHPSGRPSIIIICSILIYGCRRHGNKIWLFSQQQLKTLSFSGT